jgi:nitrite reductase/ring-hydroxylating ferredoxin subunit
MNTPEAAAPAEHLCASAELAERGLALVFDVLQYGEPVRAFALRFEGQVVAYLNRCVHVPTEMDWQHGVFLDGDQRFILCSTHGAAYEPLDGRCVGGPCGRGRCRNATGRCIGILPATSARWPSIHPGHRGKRHEPPRRRRGRTARR